MRIYWLVFSVLFAFGCADTQPPAWPGNAALVLTPTADSVRIEWTAPTDDKGVTRIVVSQDGDEVAELPGDTVEYTLEGLDDCTRVRVSVAAFDDADNRSERLHETVMTADATAPHWPAGARLRVVDNRLSWPNAEDEIGVVGYQISRDGEPLGESDVIQYDLGPHTRPQEPPTADTPAATPSAYAVLAVDEAGNESAPLHLRAGETEGEAEVETPEEGLAAAPDPLNGPSVPAPQINPAVREALRKMRRTPLPGIRPQRLEVPPIQPR